MRTLRSVIRALRTHGGSLPEPLCDLFNAAPPSGAPWPEGLPSSPVLREFYAECDGGSLGPFCFLTLAEVADDTASTAEWMEGMEPDGMPPRGRWLAFGDNEYGLSLIWDADRDAVLLYASDGGSLYDADDTSLRLRRLGAGIDGPPDPRPILRAAGESPHPGRGRGGEGLGRGPRAPRSARLMPVPAASPRCLSQPQCPPARPRLVCASRAERRPSASVIALPLPQKCVK